MKWQIVLMNLLKSEKWLARYFMKTFKPTWQNFFRSKTCPRLNLSYYVDFFLSMYSCVSRLCLLPVIQNAHFFQFFIQTLKITLACLYVCWPNVFCRTKCYLSIYPLAILLLIFKTVTFRILYGLFYWFRNYGLD